jgi:NAD(P)-dependent dehydrogenase (short-subunit alcohol dehydrogenase family)
MQLQGKTAIVTGAGRGIGAAIALAYAAEGAALVIADIDAGNARDVAGRIVAQGGRAVAIETDVRDSAQARRMVDTAIESFGGLDILVNNAGVGLATRFLDLTLEEWDRTIAINLTGVFLCTQHALRAMLAGGKGGRVVNIASICGQRGIDGRTAYSVTKAGIEVMTKILAVEFAGKGINVNAIAPGPIETQMTRDPGTGAKRGTYEDRIPMGRYGAVDEVAAAAVFLAGPGASYICGDTLNVDGGWLAAGSIQRD